MKPGEAPTSEHWKGLTDENNLPVPCSHTLPDAKPYACDSTACATVLGEGESACFCPCSKFVSPFLKKKTAKPRTPVEQVGRTLIPREALLAAKARYLAEHPEAAPVVDKAKLFLDTIAEYPDLLSLTTRELSTATGLSQSWVRRTLKAAGIVLAKASRKTTAFMTGETVPDGTAVENQT